MSSFAFWRRKFTLSAADAAPNASSDPRASSSASDASA
jgi:hypothetical protein